MQDVQNLVIRLRLFLFLFDMYRFHLKMNSVNPLASCIFFGMQVRIRLPICLERWENIKTLTFKKVPFILQRKYDHNFWYIRGYLAQGSKAMSEEIFKVISRNIYKNWTLYFNAFYILFYYLLSAKVTTTQTSDFFIYV